MTSIGMEVTATYEEYHSKCCRTRYSGILCYCGCENPVCYNRRIKDFPEEGRARDNYKRWLYESKDLASPGLRDGAETVPGI